MRAPIPSRVPIRHPSRVIDDDCGAVCVQIHLITHTNRTGIQVCARLGIRTDKPFYRIPIVRPCFSGLYRRYPQELDRKWPAIAGPDDFIAPARITLRRVIVNDVMLDPDSHWLFFSRCHSHLPLFCFHCIECFFKINAGAQSSSNRGTADPSEAQTNPKLPE